MPSLAPSHGGEWKGKKKRAKVCEKKGTLAFGEKGLHHRVVSGNVTSSLPLPRSYVSARAKGSVQLFAKFVVVSAFLFFIGSRHHYPPVSMSYEAMLFG